ncbi:tRNA (adenosine(37)-N6)-dimethylallyltransferase MiaA [Lactococcus kimchii]|uniref:tRNA (adenosine(37)-N6)-dimethylallyltransferase MiaA n=1 Tax=Lactococcus sp. S-13 TaxID=2507158 RepID=UPI0010233FD7|nr:tRNA (adenosine(37)-N6)-dimethylallyltransferase MiaA [Lactococcus sp. S-13]RZI48669.1 tRNA (adenosine(37)-N6)-dimethylallyltransferase MiaA [Lactococcus sp. S-13]
MTKNKVLVIVGPTAVGKTALGIELAQKFNGEIISGDSQQVYRGLDIGTAKVTQAEQKLAVHRLIDVRERTENFSAHDFVSEANYWIEEMHKREKLPIIVGGTGLYIQSLVEGYHLGGQENHEEMLILREQLALLSDEALFEQVKASGLEIPELNRRRAMRALEREKFGSAEENKGSAYDFCMIGLNAERKLLYQRINQRVDQMMTEGLLREAQELFEQNPTVQAAKGIGYKEFFPYFSGEMSLDEAVELVKRNSRRYAKRQLTWFKNRMDVPFFDVFDANYPQEILEKVKNFLG